MANPTIIDVAARAGVSKSTVSLVLQDSPLVRADTRMRVQAAMQDLGYVYNVAAAGLRGKAQASSAAAAPDRQAVPLSCDLSDPANAAFAAAVQAAALARGMGLHLLRAGEAAGGRKITTRLSEAEDDGAIFALHPRAPARLQEGMAAQIATRHLLQFGSSVAFIGGSYADAIYALRLRGYHERMTKALAPPLHLAGGDDYAAGRGAIQTLLDLHPDCRAALCITDQVALGVMAGLAAQGIALGDGFRVIGWGDTPAAAEAGLSSLRPDLPKLAEICLNWVQNGGDRACEIPLSLIRRQSTWGGA
ncbi:MAG: LacI family DNA-binding transcriptional regulator [Cypionkella sp.]|nr:LacI family DNA-binding transcriptional regulator [Cypionkella sp.]